MNKVSGRWRDDYLPVPLDVAEYFRRLTARIHLAEVVQYRQFAFSVKNDCRGNARRYIACYGGKIALGWLVNAEQCDRPAFMM